MVLLVSRRSFMLLLAAGSLAACGSAPLPRTVTVFAGEPTTLTLQSRSGPLLTLQNESSGHAAKVYSTTDDPLRKVVPDAELQALLDVFSAEKMFETSLSRVPPDARDVLRLEQSGRTWFWARRGSDTDPREIAFRQGRTYFLAIYNGNTAYHSAPGDQNGRRPDFETEAERVQREARAARKHLLERGRR